MSEENKDVHRRVWEEFRGQGKLDVADELLASDYVGHDPNEPEDRQGPAAAKEQLSAYRGAFPDMSASVTAQEDEGDDKVASSWTVTGTHDGDLMGIAPTGKKIEITGKSSARVEAGKVAEEWHEWSMEEMLGQIGATPADIKVG